MCFLYSPNISAYSIVHSVPNFVTQQILGSLDTWTDPWLGFRGCKLLQKVVLQNNVNVANPRARGFLTHPGKIFFTSSPYKFAAYQLPCSDDIIILAGLCRVCGIQSRPTSNRLSYDFPWLAKPSHMSNV